MAREQYDRDLHQLRMEIFHLGSHVGRMVARATESVLRRDAAIAATVSADENTADALARAIEQHAELLIVTQQPVASDMRQVAGALIVAQELERMADHAEDIAENGRLLADQDEAVELVQAIDPISQRVTELARLAMQAYLTSDARQAGRVAAMDDVVDALYRDYYERLLTSMTNEPAMVTRGVILMHIAYDLERIADRATTICERISFIATGELLDVANRVSEPIAAHG